MLVYNLYDVEVLECPFIKGYGVDEVAVELYSLALVLIVWRSRSNKHIVEAVLCSGGKKVCYAGMLVSVLVPVFIDTARLYTLRIFIIIGVIGNISDKRVNIV